MLCQYVSLITREMRPTWEFGNEILEIGESSGKQTRKPAAGATGLSDFDRQGDQPTGAFHSLKWTHEVCECEVDIDRILARILFLSRPIVIMFDLIGYGARDNRHAVVKPHLRQVL